MALTAHPNGLVTKATVAALRRSQDIAQPVMVGEMRE
jgi:hypothetical protein